MYGNDYCVCDDFCKIWLQYADISERLVAVGMAINVALSMTILVDSSSKL